MNRHFRNRRAFESRAFSLVEVVIALGVISIACVSLLGVLADCVTTFHQAMANTSEADIVQSIANDLRLDNFSDLATYVTSPPTYYYDHEGTLLTNQTGYFYQATVTLSQVSSQNSPTTLDPTTTTTAGYNVVVTITNVGDNTAYTQQHPHVYALIIANNGL